MLPWLTSCRQSPKSMPILPYSSFVDLASLAVQISQLLHSHPLRVTTIAVNSLIPNVVHVILNAVNLLISSATDLISDTAYRYISNAETNVCVSFITLSLVAGQSASAATKLRIRNYKHCSSQLMAIMGRPSCSRMKTHPRPGFRPQPRTRSSPRGMEIYHWKDPDISHLHH